MKGPVSDEALAAATAYEELHVPALFAPWPRHLLATAEVAEGDRVLDVACGTGVLARAAVATVGDAGQVTGLDVDAGMLAVAARGAPDVRWRQGDVAALPFADAAFDAVCCQFGLMFFPDRERALREMLRVLRPGGRLAIAVWDDLERSEAYPEAVALLERLAGPAAADALRAPFVLGDPDALAALVSTGGGREVTVTTHVEEARFPSIRRMVEADLRGWLPLLGVHLEEPLVERILAEAEHVLAAHVASDGSMRFRAPALVAGARRA